MSLGRISVKKIFLLTWAGMEVSMLAICAVLLWMTGEIWVLTTGGLLMLCALAWMFLLTVVFSKQLSIFTRELCRALSGESWPFPRQQMDGGSRVQSAG